MGLMQAPHKSFLAEASTSASSNPFKQPKTPATTQSRTGTADPMSKLSLKLLDIAMFPVPAYLKPPNLDERSFRAREALNEKDVPDDDEAEEDEMNKKPVAPAIKVEEDGDSEYNEKDLEETTTTKLYLSDDDISEF